MNGGRAAGLAYRETGSGPAVLLLHGIGHDRYAWTPLLDPLGGCRRLLMPDLAGHGGSPIPAGTTVLDIAALTDQVAAFLDAHGLDRPAVVGNSLGGAIALELARRGRAGRVLALSPIGFWSTAEARYALAVLRASRVLTRLPRPVLTGLIRRRTVRAGLMGLYFGRPLRLDLDQAQRTVDSFARSTGLPAILPHSGHYRCSPDGLHQEAVTIAWGTRDRLLTGGQARRARQVLPGARHVPLPGCGHVPMSDAPDRIADLIRQL